MEEVLKYRSQIYGFCAIWIVLHHMINLHAIPGFSYIPFVYPFIRMGSAGVDVFLFLSGYCLCLSYTKDPNIAHFYKKRAVRLIIPYLIAAVPYYLWRNCTIGALDNGSFNYNGFIQDIIGLSFWTKGMKNTWFVEAIIIFYILFPILYKICSKKKWIAIGMFMFSYFLIIIAYILPFPEFDNYAIAICRFPAFLLGLILALYYAPLYNNQTLIVFAVLLVLLVGVFPIKDIQESNNLHAIYLWIPYILLILPVIYLSRFLLEKYEWKFWTFLGNISLELYMVHIFMINILKWYGWNTIWIWLVVPILSIPIAYLISYISKKITVFK